MKRRAAIMLVLAACMVSASSEPATDAKLAPEPAVVRVDDQTLRIGAITLQPDTRQIRVPTRVNMTEGLLEFALVHVDGKVHESLLVTEASPTHLNLALKLLRYEGSEELFPLPGETGDAAPPPPAVPAAIRAAARVRLTVEWHDGQRQQSAALHEWIAHAVSERPMPAAEWVYGGSFVAGGRFAAELYGDLIATFVTRSALINYAGAEHDNDEAWIPARTRVPPEGSPVTLVISPAQPHTPNQPPP
jgi:hypothetical protein